MTGGLEVQLVDPIFHGQLPSLLGIGTGANQRIRSEPETLGHFDVVLVKPAELLRFRPIMPLRFLAHSFVAALTRATDIVLCTRGYTTHVREPYTWRAAPSLCHNGTSSSVMPWSKL